MTEDLKTAPAKAYSTEDLRGRRRGFLAAVTVSGGALASTLLLPPAWDHYAVFVAGVLVAVGTQQIWPWLTGEVRSRTFGQDQGGF